MKLLISAFLILLTGSAHAEVGLIRVRSYNRIFNGNEVNLLSIVDREDLVQDTVQKLGTIKLGDAPALGEQRVYSNKAIAEAIRQSGIKKSWNIQIPHQVIVENKGFEVDRETVEKQLISRWTALCGECQISIQTLQMPNIPKEQNAFPWKLTFDGKVPRGNFSSRLTLAAAGEREIIYWINGQLEIKKRVPILIRSTPMNTRFTEDDFKFDWRNVTQATDSNPSAKEIIGQKAKFSMNADDVIWSGSLVREKAVQRGEMVRVSVGEDQWEITMQAKTESDGFIGDTVNLRNLQTNRIITGKVIDSGVVQIK